MSGSVSLNRVDDRPNRDVGRLAALRVIEAIRAGYPLYEPPSRRKLPRLERSRYPSRRPFDGQLGKARCVAERCEIAARNSDWRPIGPPETPMVESTARHFPP